MPDDVREYVFPDGVDGPLVRWSIKDGAVHKDDRRVLSLGRVTHAAINNLNGRVRVREVRLRLDDDQGVSFGSYSTSALSGSAAGYLGFRDEFFAALAEVSPDLLVDTEAAILPKFSFAVFILVIGLLIGAVAIVGGSPLAVLAAGALVAFGAKRGYQFRPWDAGRLRVTARDFAAKD